MPNLFLIFLFFLYIELSLSQIQYSLNPNYVDWLPAIYHITYKLYQFPFRITHYLVHSPLSSPFLSLNLTMCVILCSNPFPITFPYSFVPYLSALTYATPLLSTFKYILSINIRTYLEQTMFAY